MKKKKLLSVIMAAALGCSLFAAAPIVSHAEETTEYSSGNWTYILYRDGCSITGYNGSEKNIIIPSALDGNSVIAIEGAFKDNKDITSVTIPDSVWYIGMHTFLRCSGLTNVDLGNSVRVLGELCFHDCDSLTSIVIPASMTSMEAEASYPFNSCDSLKNVTIESGGLEIPDKLFSCCTGLENITIPEGIIKIGEDAFGLCSSLKRISLPNSVKVIEGQAFSKCKSLEDFYDYNEETRYMVDQYNRSVFYDSPSVTIHGYYGSNAEVCAKENNLAFVPLTGEEVEEREEELGKTDKQMYRLYNPNSGEHLYTSNAVEKNNLVSLGWKSEGTAWIAPIFSSSPVYRVYNPNSGEHHYTMDAYERDVLVGLGWKNEGIGWYSDDNQGIPLYRFYNSNAVGQYEAGAHHYTKDAGERDSLINAGWEAEGIGWYGLDKRVFPDAKIGDVVTFGAYEQDNDLTNGAEPIEWQYVADRDGHKLLLSKYALDESKYHSSFTDITWEECTLRKWLNEYFYNTAFSDDEKEKIVMAYNENPDTYELYSSWSFDTIATGDDGGNATDDKVFLLSWTEARDYFDGKLKVKDLGAGNYNQKLLCRPTAYVKGLSISDNNNEYPSDTVGCCYWWLRSPDGEDYCAMMVNNIGSLTGGPVSLNILGVRPAILID